MLVWCVASSNAAPPILNNLVTQNRHKKDPAITTDGYFDLLSDKTCKAVFGFLDSRDVSSLLQLNKSFYNKWKSLLLGASVGLFGKKGKAVPNNTSNITSAPKTDPLSEWLFALSLPLEYHTLLYR